MHDISCFFAIKIDQDDFLCSFSLISRIFFFVWTMFCIYLIWNELNTFTDGKQRRKKKWWAIAFFLDFYYLLYGLFRMRSDKNETKPRVQMKKKNSVPILWYNGIRDRIPLNNSIEKKASIRIDCVRNR